MKVDNTMLFGDPAESNILKDAQIEKASFLIITITDIEKIIKIIHAARFLNSHIQIVTRAQYISERKLLEELNVRYICTESEALEAFSSLMHQMLNTQKSHYG